MKRSAIYVRIADQLAATCNASIDDDGRQRVDEADGKIWDGTVYYCIGEMARVRGVSTSDILGRDYASIALHCLERWVDDGALKSSFAAMGLAMMGPSGPEHPILGKLSAEQRDGINAQLQVTRAYANNWEIFNASLRMGRTILYGDDPVLVLPHVEKMVAKYAESGYFDDSASSGDYNNYGLMTINFALRLSEFLPPEHTVRQQIETMFRPHAQRYFKLLQVLIGADGMGWLFGRSAGVLGQLQCISYLEQLLSKGWLTGEDAAWTRRACRQLTQYMVDVFWDDERQWFSFRDDHRTCFNYRTTLPMTWDLWRYFLQLENYARLDESRPQDEFATLPSTPFCQEIITNAERHTTFLIWSDGNIKWQMPIMGGPTVMAGDNLPRPYLPGLFEWCTGNAPIPVLCPHFIKGGVIGWPAWWPSSTKLTPDGVNWGYRVVYSALVDDHGVSLDWPLSVTVDFYFGSGFFERTDHIHVSAPVTFDSIRIEALQGAPHPKSRRYPKVFAIDCAMDSNLPGMTTAEDDISSDAAYRNYFSHAARSFSLAGESVKLAPGEYILRTAIRWA